MFLIYLRHFHKSMKKIKNGQEISLYPELYNSRLSEISFD